ncbi:WW domain-binding protein 11-like [Pogoniulus pusillus]|uniref:WW domain-binding protein 11-like n=1 Tax=Pogoniulus pusillus TaxID=488313 RepID=UPI0030B95302
MPSRRRAARRLPGRPPLARPSPPGDPGPGTCTGAAVLAARRLIPRQGLAARGGPAAPLPRRVPASPQRPARAREGVPAIPGPLPVPPNPTGSAAALRLRPTPLLLLGPGRAWGSQPVAPRQFVAAASGCEGAETTARTELPLPSGPRPAPHRRHRHCRLFSSAAGWGGGGREGGRCLDVRSRTFHTEPPPLPAHPRHTGRRVGQPGRR